MMGIMGISFVRPSATLLPCFRSLDSSATRVHGGPRDECAEKPNPAGGKKQNFGRLVSTGIGRNLATRGGKGAYLRDVPLLDEGRNDVIAGNVSQMNDAHPGSRYKKAPTTSPPNAVLSAIPLRSTQLESRQNVRSQIPCRGTCNHNTLRTPAE